MIPNQSSGTNDSSIFSKLRRFIVAIMILTLIMVSNSPLKAYAYTGDISPDKFDVSSLELPGLGPIVPTSWQYYNNNPDFKPITSPLNGAVGNASSVLRIAPITRMASEVHAIPVVDGVWILNGKPYAPVVIESPDNTLIVVSTGESTEDGQLFREVIREEISDLPIGAVIYDHAHYPKGTATLLDGDVPNMIIAHPDSNEIVKNSTGLANASIPELGPNLDGRSKIQFGAYLPATGKDAMLAPQTLVVGAESAWIPADTEVAEGEILTVEGIEMQFFHAITDTEDSLTTWLPNYNGQGIAIDNVVWPQNNLYTLRGDRYRPPQDWIAALTTIRDLQPDIILSVGSGGAPIVGKQECFDAVTSLMDMMRFINDQSLRLTAQGVRADELTHHMSMPESLLKSRFVNEFYGQFDTYPAAQPTSNHGWFSGYSEDIHHLPRAVYADYLIQLSGGEENVMAAYTTAMEQGEYLWAKELAVSLYYAVPDNDTYRQALADVFRQLGQMSPGLIVRNFYINAALSLEGDDKISLMDVEPKEWVTENPTEAVDRLRIRIVPELATGVDGVLEFKFVDDNQSAALHIRNSIAEFVPDPDKYYKAVDASIDISEDNFAAYYRGEIGVDDFLANSSSTSGPAKELLSVFDEFVTIPMYPRTRDF
ncbi:MAG: alkyl sulfatase dimerization domain-containing protein [Crocosphaera sp.]|nr:alkyl sulfatase dimerization domain-containing protein [Crocosphaera sp.]